MTGMSSPPVTIGKAPLGRTTTTWKRRQRRRDEMSAIRSAPAITMQREARERQPGVAELGRAHRYDIDQAEGDHAGQVREEGVLRLARHRSRRSRSGAPGSSACGWQDADRTPR